MKILTSRAHNFLSHCKIEISDGSYNPSNMAKSQGSYDTSKRINFQAAIQTSTTSPLVLNNRTDKHKVATNITNYLLMVPFPPVRTALAIFLSLS